MYYLARLSEEPAQPSNITRCHVCGLREITRTVLYCIEKGLLVCVDELLAAFLKFLEAGELTGAKGWNKKFVFPKFVGKGRVRSTVYLQAKVSNIVLSFEPRCEKTGLRGFRPSPT